MRTQIYGILLREAPDTIKEIIHVDGVDLEGLKGHYVFSDFDMWRDVPKAMAQITDIYAVQRPEFARDEDHELYLRAGAPFIKVEAEILDNSHGRALEVLANEGKMFFAAQGTTFQTVGPDADGIKHITKCKLRGGVVAIPNPTDAIQRIFVRPLQEPGPSDRK
jgi:hypothetical protein